MWCLRSASEADADDEAARINTAPRSDAVELSAKRGPSGGPPGALGTYAAADSEDELWADTPPAANRAGVRLGFGDSVGEHTAERDDLMRGGADAGTLLEPGNAADVGTEAKTRNTYAAGQAPLAADTERAAHTASQQQPGVQHSGGAGAVHPKDGPGVT